MEPNYLPHSGHIQVLNKMYVKMLIRSSLRLWRQTTAVITECDRRNLLLTIFVRFVDDAKVEQETGSFLSHWGYSSA